MSRRFARAVTLPVSLALAVILGACSSARPPAAAPTSPPVPSATASPTPSPAVVPVSAEDDCVTKTMATMTQRQLVGQVVLVGAPIANPAGAASLVASYGLGGVFLAGRVQEPASKLRSDIAALQAGAPRGVGLLIALDQEGGQVQTLQGADFPPIPSAVAQGQLSQADLRAQTTAWAQRLASAGVNLDLAPVADTVPASLGTGNPPIGALSRQYGSDPAAVGQDVATVVAAVQSTGVLATLKHFPGLGRVTKNTDTSTGAADPAVTAQDPYLAPFTAGIKAGTGAVMVSNASYPGLDTQSIAAFSSPVITGLLRQKLGFSGLIVSDDLGNAVAVSGVPVGQRAVKFIDAGGDLALAVTVTTAGPMLDGLLAAVASSPQFAEKVTVAAAYVLRAKYKAGLLACSPAKQ
jgi:beta-N-acetylhexosaminidase